MPKCSNCKYGSWEHEQHIVICYRFQEYLDEKTAECDTLPCDGYEPDDRFNDTTEE